MTLRINLGRVTPSKLQRTLLNTKLLTTILYAQAILPDGVAKRETMTHLGLCQELLKDTGPGPCVTVAWLAREI